MTPGDLEVAFTGSFVVVREARGPGRWRVEADVFTDATRRDELDACLADAPAPAPADAAAEDFFPHAFGDLRVLGLLGRGQFGAVLDAWDPLTREALALKVLAVADPWALQCFKNEFRRLADLRHPGLVAPDELIHARGRYALAMPKVIGRDLDVVLREAAGRHDRLADEPRVRRLVIDLLHALAALHGAGLVHLDIKPSNVLVDADDRVHVLDFGLSRLRARETPGGIIGTPRYLSPEQISGAAPTPAMDLYALGVLLHEALTHGATPFDEHGKEDEERVFNRLFAPPTRLVVHRRGVDPEWAALVDALVARDPASRPSVGALLERLGAAPIVAGPGRPLAFVGRDAELAALRSRWSEVAGGPPAMALIGGAPGLGKTELARRFADAGAGYVLWARSHVHDQSPGAALDGAIEGLVELLLAAPERAAPDPDLLALAPRFPSLAALAPNVEGAPQGAAPPSISRAGDALARALARLAAPVILVIDDAHWGDADAVDLLVALLSSPHAQRLFVVITHRTHEWRGSEFGATLESRCARGVPFEVLRLELQPLADDLAATAVAAALGRSDQDPAIDRIVRLAGGAPALLALHTANAAADDALAPTERLGGLLARWPAPVRRLLEATAVALEAPLAVLARAAEVPLPTRATLSALSAAGVLTLTTRGTRSAAIRHDLLRSALQEALPPGEVATLHRRLADALAEIGADPGAIAVHRAAAGDLAEVPPLALRAADQAERGGAFARAAELLALALDAGGADLPERPALTLRRADDLRAAGLGERAADAYLDLALAPRPPIPPLALRQRAADACLVAGAIDRGLELLAPVLRAQGLAPPVAGVAGVARLVTRALPALFARDPGALPARPDPEAAERCDTCWIAARGLVFVEPVSGLDMAFRAIDEAARSGSRLRLGRAMGFIAASLLTNLPGGAVRAERWLAAIERWGEDDADLAPLVPLWRSYLAHTRGDLGAAIALGRRALDTLASLPWAAWERVQAASAVARGLRLQGEYTACAELCRAHLLDAERRGDRYAQALFGDYLSLPTIARGHLAEARARIDWIQDRWPPTPIQAFYWALHRAYADRYEGDAIAAARRLVTTTRDYRRAGGVAIVFLRIDRTLLAARLALVIDPRAVPGLGRAEALIAALGRESSAEGHGNGHLLGAALHHRRGDDRAALAALDRAIAAFEPAGIAMEAHAARLRRARLLPDPPAAAAALAHMRRLGARDPARWADLIAPGLP